MALRSCQAWCETITLDHKSSEITSVDVSCEEQTRNVWGLVICQSGSNPQSGVIHWTSFTNSNILICIQYEQEKYND